RVAAAAVLRPPVRDRAGHHPRVGDPRAVVGVGGEAAEAVQVGEGAGDAGPDVYLVFLEPAPTTSGVEEDLAAVRRPVADNIGRAVVGQLAWLTPLRGYDVHVVGGSGAVGGERNPFAVRRPARIGVVRLVDRQARGV